MHARGDLGSATDKIAGEVQRGPTSSASLNFDAVYQPPSSNQSWPFSDINMNDNECSLYIFFRAVNLFNLNFDIKCALAIYLHFVLFPKTFLNLKS